MEDKLLLDSMSPREMVAKLDRYIIGQHNAKRAVSIAIRNRVRRQQLPKELQEEIAPKNIIMIGPTGVGKTEIARRFSKITGAPFLKVEATKYTEVGYVGRDVESMIRDLMSVAINMVKDEMYATVKDEAEQRTEEVLLDLLIPKANISPAETSSENTPDPGKEYLRQRLKNKELEERMVELQVKKNVTPSLEIFSSGRLEEMDFNWEGLPQLFDMKKSKQRITIKRAREYVFQEEIDKLVDNERISEIAKERVENMGIIFIDEIDKIIVHGGARGGVDVSREGVQRDILPIVEGAQVNTRHGVINTSHILFIAAGAFHASKPSDLIPELQGRFPVRVELEELGQEDFFNILTQPENALIRQYQELLGVDGVELEFDESAILELSKLAAEVNARNENIGARRLHTIMELLLEELLFAADELKGQKIPITQAYVQERLADVASDKDLSRYIL